MATKRRKLEASEAATRISQSTSEKKNADNRLKALEKEVNKDSAQYNRDEQEIVRAQAELDALQTELSRISFSADRQAELKESLRALHASLHEKRNQCDVLSARLPRCNFHYQPPEPGFDSRRVLGPICRLFDVNDPLCCGALATIAGEQLFSVVVDNDETMNLLLKNGQLPSHIEVLTLNRISLRTFDRDILHKAQEIGGGPENVNFALDLVSCDSSLKPIMARLFGDILVCRDMKTAALVTYHPEVMRKCITWDGDEFSPEGTVTGGSPVKEVPILIQLTKLKQLEKDLKTLEAQLSQNTAELQAMQLAEKKYTSLQQRYEKMSHKLKIMKARLAQNL